MTGDGLERPRGLEPPPTAWQAVVLPLYYGRFSQQILYNMQERLSQEPVRCVLRAGTPYLCFQRREAFRRQVRKPGRLACSLQRVIFFADARTLQLSHDRYRRDRTFHHRGKTQSPANGGACDACLCRALFSFSFSRLCHSRHQKLWQLTGRGASANLGSNSKTNLELVARLTYPLR